MQHVRHCCSTTDCLANDDSWDNGKWVLTCSGGRRKEYHHAKGDGLYADAIFCLTGAGAARENYSDATGQRCGRDSSPHQEQTGTRLLIGDR